ncbi:hypothetical protein TEA_015389 [Camellia sinensis var. sinensis]|uniref:PLAC8 family protein n=1 Tax=Camellia sinensis var. sinensis TaxID=542762 RepID=A0A4S4EGH6_CAMSN|nr:hypothetical protein TEA_015389 [Camellia sinensis var. sinensis]
MAEAEKVGAGVKEEEEEEQKFLEGVTVLDFDMLCSTVASQTQGKWRNLDTLHHDESQDGVVGAEFGGVLRMWEGEVVNCFDDRRIALQSVCCPCYRFGKNMGRAGFGSCFVQGSDGSLDDCIYHLICPCCTLCQGSDGSLDDCIYHLICPCCTLCQESRTLEMNNVQDGTWHGRGDTICIGRYGEGNKAFFELQPPPIVSTKSSDPRSPQKCINAADHSWTSEVAHSAPLDIQHLLCGLENAVSSGFGMLTCSKDLIRICLHLKEDGAKFMYLFACGGDWNSLYINIELSQYDNVVFDTSEFVALALKLSGKSSAEDALMKKFNCCLV